MCQAEFFASEDGDAIYGVSISDEERLCAQTFGVGWGNIFDRFLCSCRSIYLRGKGHRGTRLRVGQRLPAITRLTKAEWAGKTRAMICATSKRPDVSPLDTLTWIPKLEMPFQLFETRSADLSGIGVTYRLDTTGAVGPEAVPATRT